MGGAKRVQSNRKGAARQGKARQEQELMLLEREKDASALINVLLGNQNEFVAWRSQTDRAGRDRQRQTDKERSWSSDNTFKSFEAGQERGGKGNPKELGALAKLRVKAEKKRIHVQREMRHAATRVR